MYTIFNNINHTINALTNSESLPTQEQTWQFTIANINTQVMQFLHAAGQMLPALILGVLAIIGCYFLARPLSYLLLKPLGYVSESRLLHVVTRRFISILIILFGIYLFLRLAGLTQFAVAVMSGTGLLGLILGFAFRDIAENFISSMLLSVQRPFKIDDVIEVNGHLGVVKKVTARATTLVDFDGNHIQIPNANVYKNVIKNLTANPKMRGHFTLGIGYDNDIKSAQRLALTLLNKQAPVLSEPAPQVLINDLGSATVNFTIYFWVNSEQHSVLKVASQLMRELVNNFTKQGISMPDDARERVLVNSQGDDIYPMIDEKSALKMQPEKRVDAATHQDDDTSIDDISSDTDEIREQAEESRDPEQGSNII
ncbi:mechanosensitive ion channel family protein [Pseudoalteromonas shioyasakiensis]|uniref:mechanosensitive ion channel family protein n=1 Tax=Pseudoalteromonas shioyasakiensis TaxID=1190813 RepID=UPI0021193404|nr:mechanosensitive ion channel domain-containing protein [Pseudoalteromonas shioyasakiensis]MCQ8879968.1 mechanosensitive ion channel family protein [Pseudoalteromonas shioyasakiensis]